MENFFVDGNFYTDLSELMEDLDVDVEYDVEAGLDVLEDDWYVRAYYAESAPIFKLTSDDIVSFITEQYNGYPDDDNDYTYNKTVEAIRAGIDVDKINSLMPDVWRPTKNKFTITKADIIKYIG